LKFNKKLNTKFDAAESSPGFLFWKVANLHQRLQRQVLKDLDISPTQYSLLACYFFLKTPTKLPTQSDICEMAGLNKMLVSDTTKALLRKKLVSKKINKDDQRSFFIELTDEGKLICNKAVKLIEVLDDKFFALTGNTKTFHTMLHKIETNSITILKK
jgi:DNA-binding MarR family transcriptional regulator